MTHEVEPTQAVGDESMLHHVSLPVADLAKSSALYDEALAALGYRRVCSAADFAGYGTVQGKDRFAIKQINPSASAGVRGARDHLPDFEISKTP
jgi:catechol 2,3-dioxygenase-like lactoylglutathione lyase family enzyme